jgi:hypothetical protein
MEEFIAEKHHTRQLHSHETECHRPLKMSFVTVKGSVSQISRAKLICLSCGAGSTAEYVLSLYEALGSIPTTIKNTKPKT